MHLLDLGKGRRHPQALLLLLLALLSLSQAEASAPVCHRLDDLLGRLSDLVDFYASDPDRVNADGYFGMEISRSLLSPQLVQRTAFDKCGSSAGSQLESVLTRQDVLAERFANNLAVSSGYDGDTFKKICVPMAERMRLITGSPRNELPLAHRAAGIDKPGWPADGGQMRQLVDRLLEYDEPEGDSCLVRSLRPGNSVGITSSVRCPIKADCPYFARSLDQSSGYFLTHQLLYRMMNQLAPCGTRAPQASHGSELKSMCEKIMLEFQLIAASNWTKIVGEIGSDSVTGLRDLYMEQGLLCGLLGAKDFYRPESIGTVKSWQDSRLGCFKLFGANYQTGEAAAAKRKILRDAEMLGGCSAHSTGVAMGYYSNAIRFLLEV